jgi:hydrogenase expression/formation protein HypC
MCLAIPAKILSIDKTTGLADISGVTRNIDLRLVAGVKTGDYVLVHAGFGIEKIDEKEARKTLKLLREIENRGRSKRGHTKQRNGDISPGDTPLRCVPV